MIFESKELLINWKRTPDEDSQEFNAFWANERKKCREGITIDGVFINPFLYWHCNLWTIITDHITRGRIRAKPSFRDSEWLLTNKIWEAETFKDEHGNIKKKGVVAAGTRRFSKSVIEASFGGWKAECWKNSQFVVAGGNEADIKIITDMMDLGINELPNYFIKSKVEDNWKKQVSLGFKDKSTNQREIFSTIAIRNFNDGNNEEALAGLTPNGGVIDEAGKYPFLKALIAGLPGLATANGWRGTFLVMGTGGDMDNFQDFQTLFDDPESYNFLSCDLPEENRKCGIFLPGWMSYAYPKKTKSFAEYLGLSPEEHPNLDKVSIDASDKEQNEAIIDEERKQAAKSNDPSALLKATMYFPKNTREIFLSASNNNFPIETAKVWKERLLEEWQPNYVDLFKDEKGQVKYVTSSLLPIMKFPVNSEDFKEAPVCIYEFPQSNVPHGTYAIGVDAYNKNESSDRINSLGTIYVFKRMYDPLGKLQNQIVASYAGRPSDINKFYEIAMLMCEFYEGIMLPELNERFADYFINKKKGYYIHNAMRLAQDINTNTKATGADKGLPATTRNQRYYMEQMVQYTLEEDENGLMGIMRIPDPMLLEEMINYRAKKTSSNGIHDGNFDRIVAFGHCLVLAQHLDKYMPIANWNPNKKTEDEKKKPVIRTPFGNLTTKNPTFFSNSSERKFKNKMFI